MVAGVLKEVLLRSQQPPQKVVSSGFEALDRLLPAGGIRRGSLTEWLLPGGLAGGVASSGGITLACAVAVHVSSDAEETASTVIVVDRSGRFHPPAVFPWLGGNRVRIVVARPSKDDDESWAIDQSLRCPGVSAVLAWPRRIDSTSMRRWQLAARSSGAIGLFARRIEDRREPSWADVRLVVQPLPSEKRGPAFSAAPFASRSWRISTVAGPVDFEERSAVVAVDASTGLQSADFQVERRKEVVRCHAS